LKKEREKVDKWVESEPELERKVRADFGNKGIDICFYRLPLKNERVAPFFIEKRANLLLFQCSAELLSDIQVLQLLLNCFSLDESYAYFMFSWKY